MVAMETFKNEILVLSSFFCSSWYIICKNSEKKIFVRPNPNPEAPYAMIQHTEKIFYCYGAVQDRHIRTQLEERITKIYNMSIF